MILRPAASFDERTHDLVWPVPAPCRAAVAAGGPQAGAAGGNRAFDMLTLGSSVAANLKIQVSALRCARGDGQGGNRYIVTVAGQGYHFVAPVLCDSR